MTWSIAASESPEAAASSRDSRVEGNRPQGPPMAVSASTQKSSSTNIRTRSDRGQFQSRRALGSFWLDLNGFFHPHHARTRPAYFNRPPAFHIRRDDLRSRPVQIPTVFNRDQRVRAGNNIAQAECAVQVALVTAEKIVIHCGVLRNEHHHRFRKWLCRFFGNAFDINADRERQCDAR